MSKSKRNVVSPEDIISRYGADTERVYTLFMGPPDRDIDWTEEGIRGSFRFLNRLWGLVIGNLDRLAPVGEKADPDALDEPGLRLWRRYNATVKKVTEDIEVRFSFNTAVAAIMEFTNDLARYLDGEADPALLRETFEGLVLILSPMAPFLCEELWRRLGHDDAVLKEPWPSYDEDALQAETVEIPVQINGKLRARISVPVEVASDREALGEAALADPEVAPRLEGKTLVKTIAVPGKMVSIVVK